MQSNVKDKYKARIKVRAKNFYGAGCRTNTEITGAGYRTNATPKNQHKTALKMTILIQKH